MLTHLVRYLVHHPRVSYLYPWGGATNEIVVYVDTDFAGCKRTRRSTIGGVLMMGACTLKHWSATQATIALSSGEAELRGIVKGASLALGFKNMARDLGVDVTIRIHSDSTAAIGISKRRGLGKISHLAVGDLWVQERLKNRDFDLVKMLGTENPADVLTKYTDEATLQKMVNKMGLTMETGRADSTPTIAALCYRIHINSRRSTPFRSGSACGSPVTELCGDLRGANWIARNAKTKHKREGRYKCFSV